MKKGVIIVLYHPDLETLSKSLDTLSPQVDLICLVDNTSLSCAEAFSGKDKVHYIPLCKNTGIAFAQNRGIDFLRQQGCHYVLFCDQDSVSPSNLVTGLIATFEALSQAGFPVAVVGPDPIEPRNGKTCYSTSSIYITPSTIIVDGIPHHIHEMHSIISSYSLTTMDILDQVGPMEEALFIDGVDNEWSWRARHRCGLRSYLDHNLRIHHVMGTETSLPLRKSAPRRLYYQYRNFIILSHRSYTPSYWTRHCLWTYILKFFFYPLFMSPRVENFRNIIRGIRDGFRLRGQLTPLI